MAQSKPAAPAPRIKASNLWDQGKLSSDRGRPFAGFRRVPLKGKLVLEKTQKFASDYQRTRTVEEIRRCAAVPNISFTVGEADRIGVIGRTGRGSPTLLEMLWGASNRTAGTWRSERTR